MSLLSGPVLAKVGLGNMNEVVTIAGQSALTDAGGFTSHYTSGILALPTNIGTYKQDKFAVIPEAEIKLNFKLTRNLEATVGYDFIYWSTLALAGEQIDTSWAICRRLIPASGLAATWIRREARIPRSAESRIRACGCRACRWA